jgi:hypothetical protein
MVKVHESKFQLINAYSLKGFSTEGIPVRATIDAGMA